MTNAWMLVLGLVTACGSKGSPADRAGKVPGLARVPSVATAAVLVTDTSEPPPIVIVMDATGALHANMLATWDALATTDPMLGAYPTDLRSAAPLLAGARSNGLDVESIYKLFAKRAAGSLEVDDAPPVPDEDDSDPDNTESEFSTEDKWLSIEEGESEPPPGKYHDEVVRQRAEVARTRARARAYRAAGARDRPGVIPGSPWTARSQRTVTGEVVKDGHFEPPYCLFVAAPTAQAGDVIDTIVALHPRIAVVHEGMVRQLRLETVQRRGLWPERSWIEVRVGTTDLVVEAVPAQPIRLMGALDQAAFAAALEQARQLRDLDPLARVDVLVETGVDAQRLIDVVVALDVAGVVLIGFGRTPDAGSHEARLRGTRRSQLSFGAFNMAGDLPKHLIKAMVKRAEPALHACYDRALATTPGLRGSVAVRFLIKPDGTVGDSEGAGVDPALDACLAGVIKTAEFPKPADGGYVQAQYELSFEE